MPAKSKYPNETDAQFKARQNQQNQATVDSAVSQHGEGAVNDYFAALQNQQAIQKHGQPAVQNYYNALQGNQNQQAASTNALQQQQGSAKGNQANQLGRPQVVEPAGQNLLNQFRPQMQNFAQQMQQGAGQQQQGAGWSNPFASQLQQAFSQYNPQAAGAGSFGGQYGQMANTLMSRLGQMGGFPGQFGAGSQIDPGRFEGLPGGFNPSQMMQANHGMMQQARGLIGAPLRSGYQPQQMGQGNPWLQFGQGAPR